MLHAAIAVEYEHWRGTPGEVARAAEESRNDEERLATQYLLETIAEHLANPPRTAKVVHPARLYERPDSKSLSKLRLEPGTFLLVLERHPPDRLGALH